MLKIAIVEDEKILSDELLFFINRYSQENKIELKVKTYSCTTDFLMQYIKYDIVFMDINIKNDMSGIEASKKLRKIDTVVSIIFVTSFPQFAVKGYEVGAFDFIVKPITYFDFEQRLKRVLIHLSKEKTDTIDIRVKGNIKIISIKDIKYIEVIKHNLLIHCINGTYESSGSLIGYEEILTKNYFVRCNHCYLVNLWYVKGVDGYMVDLDGELIAISHSKKKDFMSALNIYLGK